MGSGASTTKLRGRKSNDHSNSRPKDVFTDERDASARFNNYPVASLGGTAPQSPSSPTRNASVVASNGFSRNLLSPQSSVHSQSSRETSSIQAIAIRHLAALKVSSGPRRNRNSTGDRYDQDTNANGCGAQDTEAHTTRSW